MFSSSYTLEFKETIVQLHDSGKPVSDFVKEYDIANQSVFKWIKLYGKSKTLNPEDLSLHELQQMRKGIAKMKEKNEILKKAFAIFSKK